MEQAVRGACNKQSWGNLLYRVNLDVILQLDVVSLED